MCILGLLLNAQKRYIAAQHIHQSSNTPTSIEATVMEKESSNELTVKLINRQL